ncbi:MAG TPA: HEAT repeat domain-containing protein [Candidatus Binatia bacterium]|jgi:HEAT repeat protein|nr:HEAT repeat domain-containing protein [Candidatus Binatia bacterium]
MDFTQIATQLCSDNISVRLAALAALGEQNDQLSLPTDVLFGLLHCLGHNRKAVQRGAAGQLVRFARTQPEVVTALLGKLTDPDPRVRWTAAFTLSHIDLPEPTPLPVLMENLGHEESDLRWAAATAVLRLAGQHPRVIAEVLRLAGSGNPVQRRMALYCLRDLGRTDPEAQGVYLASLDDSDPMVRLSGLSCLGKLRLVSAQARTALLRLLEADPDLGVRRASVVALGQLGDSTPLVIEALRKAARADDVGLSKAATGALKALGAEFPSPSPSGRGLS